MKLSNKKLVQYCNQLLNIQQFKDYCPNGLQVEGKHQVSRIVTGVTACEALIDKAIEYEADAILVHHGYFWKGEASCLTGIKGRRVKKLMQNDINLLAYHLPLDAHSKYGNNVQLAKLLGFEISGGLDDSANPIGLVGQPVHPMPVNELAEKIFTVLRREPFVLGDSDRLIEKVAWCTGAAQSMITQAEEKSVDCFITGEVSEQTVHLAREYGIVFIAAGHHATERCGVQALGSHLGEKFSIDVTYIDIDNPV